MKNHPGYVKHFIVTGGGRGLGLETTRRLAKDSSNVITVAARNPETVSFIIGRIGENVTVKRLDLASFQSIRRFCEQWSGPIAGLVNNAGVQNTTSTRFTVEGYEETFGVNYIGAFKLTLGLLENMHQSRVVFIGSGTHDPNHPMAPRFGFRGGIYKNIDQAARGEFDTTNPKQAGLDRYAASKLLITSITKAMAQRVPEEVARFYCMDPGMMPGTDLAREAPSLVRFAWNHILPLLIRWLPDTHTVAGSGESTAWLVSSPDVSFENGAVISYDKKPSKYVSDTARDPEFAEKLYQDTMNLLKSGSPRYPG